MIVVRLVPIAIVAGVVFLFKDHVIYVLVVKIAIIVKYVQHFVNLLMLKQGGAFMDRLHHVTWFNTSRCNLDCEYCFTKFDEKYIQESSNYEVGKAVIDFLLINSTATTVGLSFFGGEPLLEKGLMKDVIGYAKKRGKIARKNFTFGLTTNATLLDEELVRWLKENQVNMILSLDGLPHPENKRVFPSGEPSGPLVLEKAQLVLENGIQPIIRWTISPPILKYLYSDFKQLLKMGFVIFAIDPVYEVEWTPDDIALYEQELLKISKLYLNRLREGKNTVVKPLDDALRIFSMEERQSTRCGLATAGVGIDPRGNIYACHRFIARGGPILGNVFTGWDDEALKKAQEWDLSKVRSENGSCHDCPVKLRCPGGGCLCANLDVCNDIYINPAIFCELQRINQRVANDIAFILYAEKNELFKRKLERPDLPT
mgnify:FL=1